MAWDLSALLHSADPAAEAIGVDDFRLGPASLESALDLVAVCRGPRRH